MKFVSNTLEFPLSEIVTYSKEEATDWKDLLKLAELKPIISIRVSNDNEPNGEVISAVWKWANEYQELQLFKIKCSHDLLSSIGPTIFSMIKAIGLHVKTKKITLSAPTDSYEWKWYQEEMGFKEVGREVSGPPSPNLELIL